MSPTGKSNFDGMVLYHYWRSSASYRVRIALGYKHLEPKMIPVSLLDGSSESPEHLKRNPMGYVPVLEVNGKYLVESVAIIEWLEEMIPTPPLFPADSYTKAQVRALVEYINAGTQPLQNLNVTEYYSPDPAQQKTWSAHFALNGLKAYETQIASTAGTYSLGETFTAADVFLVPQAYSALRFEIPLEKECPLIWRIYQNCLKLDFVQKAHPDLFKPE